ncbi:uncharacterized protein LOC120326589 isoform X2 [Styela clava]
MEFFKIIFFISLIGGYLAEIIVPAGACVSKIVNGKLVQVGNCEKNDGSDIIRLIKKSRDDKKKAENKCDVTYKKKCYRIVVYDRQNINLNKAESICKSMNGKLANIYDLKHYQLLRTHQRSMIPAGRSGIATWTGMKYKNNQLLLSSGEPITIAKEVWFYTFPESTTSNTKVAVYVRKETVQEHRENQSELKQQ